MNNAGFHKPDIYLLHVVLLAKQRSIHFSRGKLYVAAAADRLNFNGVLDQGLYFPIFILYFSLSLLLPSPILSVRPPLTAGELGRPARLPERPAAVVLGVRLLPYGDHVDRRVRRHCLRDLARQGLPSHVPPRRTRKYSNKIIIARPRGCG